MIMGMEITSSIVHTPKAINIEKMRRKKTHRLLITKFLIISPPFFIPLYHTFDNKSRRSLVSHPHLVAVYHQHEVLYLIKPQVDARWHVMRYSPKGADDMHRTSRGDDMPSLRLG
ncbi:MAG: hypothetical protein J6Q70_01465 [Clostridia bacterium]|nr:hypothetical protein [Clostridia bacterium]